MATYTGDMIKKIRKEKGLTQKQLGELCGMADSAVRRYESGRQNPKIETLEKIAAALDVTVDRLLARKIVIPIKKPTLDSLRERIQEEKELDFLNKMDELGMKLNDTGQKKAIEQVELLTKIPAYRAVISENEEAYYKMDKDGNLIPVEKPINSEENKNNSTE